MTNQEASKVIKDGLDDMSIDYTDEEQQEALTMAITALEQEPSDDMVSRGVFEQVMWERDIAIEQLHELGYGLGQKIEPSGDLISREPFTDSTICEGFSCDECSFNRKDKGGCILEERVMNLPSVKQERTGHWITQWNVAHQKEYYYCSECREEFSYDGETGIKMNDYRYCPNCGAKMVEPQDKDIIWYDKRNYSEIVVKPQEERDK